MLRFLRYIVEALAALVGVTVVLGLLLAWRLSVMPTSSDFLTPYIKAGIESIIPDSQVSLGSTVLAWNGAERAIAVHAENIVVSDASAFEIADISSFDAKISLVGLIFGQFMPKDFVIDHPQIKMDRLSNGVFVFGGVAVGGAQDKQAAQPFDGVVRNVTKYLSHAAFMHKLAVTRAVFDIHDEGTQKDWSVSVPEISITRKSFGLSTHGLERGALEGRMTVAVTQKDAEASLDVNYAYDPAREQHTLTSVFNDLTPAFVAGGHPESLGLDAAAIIDLPLTGKVALTLDKNLTILNVSAQIHGDEGHLVYADFWDHPCPIQSFDLNADYDRAAHKLAVSDTSIDFGGPTLGIKIEGVASSQKGQDLDFTATLKVDNLPINRYGEIWPKPVLADPRYWLTSNLRDGMFSHGDVALKGALAFNDLANLNVTDGNGKISAIGGRVTYVDGLPPVEGVNAIATFDLKKMDVQITSGNIGNIHLTPFTLKITGLADPDQDIDIPLQVAGPIPDVLRLLDHQPLGYAKALGISPDDIGGKIEGAVNFHFPLLKTLAMKDVVIHASANASAVASSKLIPGMALDQGNLALTLDTSGLNFKGQVALNKVPFQVVWQENFEEQKGQPLRHVSVTGAIKNDQWGNFGFTAFDGSKGSSNVTLEMTRPVKNKTVFTGVLDMTPAALNIGMMNWKKPANAPATLKYTAYAVVGKPVVVSSIALRGAQIFANGDAIFSPDMSQLLSLNLTPLTLGRTNATLHFTQAFGEQGALRFDASGTSLDVAGLRGGNDPASQDPRPKEYHINVDRLYTGDTGEIDKAQGSAARDHEGWRDINLHGLADGDTALSIALTPQPDGHRSLEIACESFGKAMNGLGFTDAIKGGKLSVTGQSSVDDPRVIIGTAKIGDFTVEKLPVLALLLNAASPFGFVDILTDRANFSRFEGDFRWQGDVLTLTRAHAAGSAVGINVDGKVDMNSGDANLQGTLVPFSVMNNLLNYIPLIGGLITGGQDQGVLAVSYSIKGKLSAPNISVNPVSLLTPGFVRNIFFRDDGGDGK
jgi:hypothetical protein